MSPRFLILPLLAAACLLPAGPASGGEIFDANTAAFLAKVDTSALGMLCVQMPGRLGILDTLATAQLDQMYGADRVEGAGAAAAYLEFYFRSGAYAGKPIIYIRERKMRAELTRRLSGPAREQIEKTRRIAPALLLNGEAWMYLSRCGRAGREDFERTAELGSLQASLAELYEGKEFRVPMDRLRSRYSSFLADGVLRLAPGPGRHWRLAEEIFAAPLMPGAADPLGAEDSAVGQWRRLRAAWLARDADGVNKAIRRLEELLPREAGASYPPAELREMERFYTATNQLGFAWYGMAVSMVLMIVAVSAGGGWARRIGLSVFLLSTVVLVVAFVVRWMISGRAWYLPPMMNQYEAVVGSAMLAAGLAFALEVILRRDYFALAAAFYATVCWIAMLIFPEQMSAEMRALPGILSSPIMAIHVSVIILGHALVGMTFPVSLVYLGIMIFHRDQRPSSPADLRRAGAMSTLAAIDRCNLIVSQLAAWSVVAGTILGAYWGDFAWGRWWGWDPKETWALITAVIFVMMLHVRFLTPVRSRGLVTSIICIFGTLAMLFNWVIVNFVLAGKHSYA